MAVPPSAPLPCSPFYLRRQAPCPQCSWGMEEKAAASAGCREPPGAPRAAAVPCFGISVDQDDILPGALRLIQELRPHWKPEQVRTKVAERARGRAGALAGLERGCVYVCPCILPGGRPRGARLLRRAGLQWWFGCVFCSICAGPEAQPGSHLPRPQHPPPRAPQPPSSRGSRAARGPPAHRQHAARSGPTPCRRAPVPLAAPRSARGGR